MKYTKVDDIELSKIQKPEWAARRDTYVDPHFIDSIKGGVIEPIVVRVIDGEVYELVCGGRRVKAAEEAGLNKIRAQIWEMTDSEAWKMMDEENFQREEVNAMDRAASIVFAMEKFGWSQDQVGAELHMKKGAVSNLLRVYRNPILAEKVKNGEHSLQTALELISIMPQSEKVPGEYMKWLGFVDKTVGLSVGRIRRIIRSPPAMTRSRKCDGCNAEIRDGNPKKKLELCDKCTEIVVKYFRTTPRTS